MLFILHFSVAYTEAYGHLQTNQQNLQFRCSLGHLLQEQHHFSVGIAN